MTQFLPNRYLAIDVGDRRIGVAAGSSDARLARPVEVITRSGEDDQALVRRLRQLLEQEQAGVIVVGDPLNMDGSAGERSRVSHRFAKWLRRALRQVRVVLCDERLSSFAADEWMERDGVRRSQRKHWRDAYAAAAILQDYFDAQADAANEQDAPDESATPE